MEPLIELVCDEHVTRDLVGPFVTRVGDVWAYCAGHGESGHRWKRIAPTPRADLEISDGGADKAAG